MLACCAAVLNTFFRGRDPQKPKRPQNAFLLFVKVWMAKRQKTDLPNKQTEVMTQAGQAWHDLPAENKAKFRRDFDELNKSYKKEMNHYRDSGREAIWMRDPRKPKRPSPIAFLYYEDHKDEIKDEIGNKGGNIVKKIADLWKGLPEETQAVYKMKYQRMIDQWRKDMDAYRDKGWQREWMQKVGIKFVDDDKILERNGQPRQLLPLPTRTKKVASRQLERLKQKKEEDKVQEKKKARKKAAEKKAYRMMLEKKEMKRRKQTIAAAKAEKEAAAIAEWKARRYPVDRLDASELQMRVSALAEDASLAEES